jgi:hypothetical protein
MGKIFTVNGPTNWWRVAAMAAVPLFIYTTCSYVEAQATLNHLRDDLQLPSQSAPKAAPAPVAPAAKK